MSKTLYWITDAENTYAIVEGADERDRWTRTQGWAEATTEPGRLDFVWVRHENPALDAVRMTAEAARLDAWAGRGWAPGAPPEPVNLATAHWPTVEPVVDPPKSSPAKAPATSGDKKE